MSDLCQSCGLCCQGAFFSCVPVGADEIQGLPPHFELIQLKNGEQAFRQPCPAHENNRCTLYAQRPRNCRTFECGLLEDHKAGRIDLTSAQQIVAETKQRLSDALKPLPPVGHRRVLVSRIMDLADMALEDPDTKRRLFAFAEKRGDHTDVEKGEAQFLIDALMLTRLVRKHFNVRRPEKAPATDAAGAPATQGQDCPRPASSDRP